MPLDSMEAEPFTACTPPNRVLLPRQRANSNPVLTPRLRESASGAAQLPSGGSLFWIHHDLLAERPKISDAGPEDVDCVAELRRDSGVGRHAAKGFVTLTSRRNQGLNEKWRAQQELNLPKKGEFPQESEATVTGSVPKSCSSRDLTEVIESWPKLTMALRRAVLSVVRSARGTDGGDAGQD